MEAAVQLDKTSTKLRITTEEVTESSAKAVAERPSCAFATMKLDVLYGEYHTAAGRTVAYWRAARVFGAAAPCLCRARSNK